MSPTRYSDPVTRTCTRRPLFSLRSSAALERIALIACRRQGTTTPAADSNDDDVIGAEETDDESQKTEEVLLVSSPPPLLTPPPPPPPPPPSDVSPPATPVAAVAADEDRGKGTAEHPLCFLASSSHVRANPACHAVFSNGPAKGTKPLLELSEGANIAG